VQRIQDLKETETRLREEYEGKFLEVQRKSEDIIKYYRSELHKVTSTPSLFNATGLISASPGGPPTILHRSICRTTPFQKMQQTGESCTTHQEPNTLGTQVVMQAYLDAVEEIKTLK
jgi:hypothetical protein